MLQVKSSVIISTSIPSSRHPLIQVHEKKRAGVNAASISIYNCCPNKPVLLHVLHLTESILMTSLPFTSLEPLLLLWAWFICTHTQRCPLTFYMMRFHIPQDPVQASKCHIQHSSQLPKGVGADDGGWRDKVRSQNTEGWGQVKPSFLVREKELPMAAAHWFTHSACQCHITPLCLSAYLLGLPQALCVLRAGTTCLCGSPGALHVLGAGLTLSPCMWSISRFSHSPQLDCT